MIIKGIGVRNPQNQATLHLQWTGRKGGDLREWEGKGRARGGTSWRSQNLEFGSFGGALLEDKVVKLQK